MSAEHAFSVPEVDIAMKGMNDLAKATFSEQVAREALDRLSFAYDGKALEGHAVPVNVSKIGRDFKKAHMNHQAEIYGEMLPQGVLNMLALAVGKNANLRDSQGHFKPGHFYDLGSGFGKITMLASLLGFQSNGIELATSRFNVACESLGKLDPDPMASPSDSECGSAGMGKAKFSRGSFVEDEVDISDADVIFTDSVFWTTDMMQTLGQKASKMKSGSVIVSFKLFPGSEFKDLGSVVLPASWDAGTTWHVQQRI